MSTEKRRVSAAFVIPYLKPYRWLIALLIGLFLLEAVFLAVQPLVMAPVVDVVLGTSQLLVEQQGNIPLSEVNLNNISGYMWNLFGLSRLEPFNIVVLLGGLYALLSVLLSAAKFGSFYVGTQIRIRGYRDIQQDVFGHLLSLSFDFFNKQRIGALMSRLEADALYAIENVVEGLRILVTAPFMVIFFGYMLVSTNLRLTLLVTVAAITQWALARLLRRMVRSRLHDQFNMMAETNAYIQEVLTNVRVVKSYVAERYERSRFAAVAKKLLPIHFRFAVSKHMYEPLSVAVNGLANATILLLAAIELLNGNLTVPGFALFLYLGRGILAPITQLAQVYILYQQMDASAERVNELMSYEPLVVSGPRRIEAVQQEIRFNHVNFSYEEEPVLVDADFAIGIGQTTALVGPSGAGKSTIIDLLLRFYDPLQGNITVDGVDLREFNLEDYRRLFGVVAQENLMFNASVADNIAYGRPDLDAGAIRSAAEVANATEFIDRMPKQFDTMIGDRGVLVSGGQRQRIAIARAIVDQPPVLVLDEATSSLDTASERLVQDAIDRVIQDTTAVIIAHRLSTVINADKIVVIEEGCVIDQGKHEELLGRCALYQYLCELQFETPTAAVKGNAG